MIDTTYRRYGLSLDARIDTRHPSDPDCRDPEVEPVEIVDHNELMETVCGDEILWGSFVNWLKTPAVTKELAKWADEEFGNALLKEACEE